MADRPSPTVDLSALSAVQTVFEPVDGIADPWGVRISGSLANAIIYSSALRIILPYGRAFEPVLKSIVEPSLVHDFFKSDDGFHSLESYSTDDYLRLSEESIDDAFRHFTLWALRNEDSLRTFNALHKTRFIQDFQRIRVARGTTYDLAALRGRSEFKRVARRLKIKLDDLTYIFDLVLRTPFYGQITGGKQHYLNHPLRDAFKLSGAREVAAKPPPIALTFAPTYRAIAGRLRRSDYVDSIKILRDKVQQLELDLVTNEEVTRELVRKLMIDAKLPPRLKSESNLAGITLTLISAAGGSFFAGPMAMVFGVGVSVAQTVWATREPHLPPIVGQVSWLR